jgi:hypothetical protein
MELIRILLPKHPAPVAHGSIDYDEMPWCHELFDVPAAQAEAEVEADKMADDLCWKPMAPARVACR